MGRGARLARSISYAHPPNPGLTLSIDRGPRPTDGRPTIDRGTADSARSRVRIEASEHLNPPMCSHRSFQFGAFLHRLLTPALGMSKHACTHTGSPPARVIELHQQPIEQAKQQEQPPPAIEGRQGRRPHPCDHEQNSLQSTYTHPSHACMGGVGRQHAIAQGASRCHCLTDHIRVLTQ